MTHFSTCLAKNGLGEKLEVQWGKYGHFTQENADLVLKTAKQEDRYGSLFLLASMIALTWGEEGTFNFNPLPQVNCPCREVWPHTPGSVKPGKKDACNFNIYNVWKWDIGPMQGNLMWTHRMAWQEELSPKGTVWVDVFGTSFYEPDSFKPCAFNGKTFPHLVIGTRRLLATKGDFAEKGYASRAEMQVVKYCGPETQPYRLKNWRKYDALFQEFFAMYSEGK